MVRVLYMIVLVAGLGYLLWPYASLFNLSRDLNAADIEAVREHADWASVRRGLAADLEAFAKQAAATSIGSGGGGARITLSWDALPIADQIAGLVATPEGLIALHQNPAAISCAVDALSDLDPAGVGKCLEQQIAEAGGNAGSGGIQGPNFPRIFEKFDYAFFTGLLTFRFVVLHEDVPVTLEFSRRAEGWLLVRVHFPFDQALARTG